MENYFYGQKSKSFLTKNMHKMIFVFMDEVIKDSIYDISIIDGARDVNMQNKLFKKNKTELDGVKNLSDHQVEKYGDNLGRAIDFIPYIPTNKLNIWDTTNPDVHMIWSECFRSILRIDRLWKEKGIDVGLELGFTYNIGSGRDYPHVSFKRL